MNRAEYRLGLLLVTASAVAWSTAGLFTRLIPLDAWTILAWRGLFSALGTAAVIAAMKRGVGWRGYLGTGWPEWLFACVSAVGMILFISSLRHTTVAHVAIIYATVPFVAAGLAWLVMREKPVAGAIGGSLVALAGIVLMVGFGGQGGLVGDVLALGMTLCMAAIMVIARHFRDIAVMPAACMSGLLSSLLSWPFGAPLAVSGEQLLLLALFGIASAVGLALFTLGARLLPAVETALIGSLDTPLAPLWVWLFFAEMPDPATIVGGMIVFGAVAVHLARSTRRVSSSNC